MMPHTPQNNAKNDNRPENEQASKSVKDIASLHVGHRLLAARETLGISLDDIVDRTKVKAEYIRAIENGDYDQLPIPAFTNAYVKTYAELLQLEADHLLSDFQQEWEAYRNTEAGGNLALHPVIQDTPTSAAALEHVLSANPRDTRNTGTPLAVIAIILIGVIACWVFFKLLNSDRQQIQSRPSERVNESIKIDQTSTSDPITIDPVADQTASPSIPGAASPTSSDLASQANAVPLKTAMAIEDTKRDENNSGNTDHEIPGTPVRKTEIDHNNIGLVENISSQTSEFYTSPSTNDSTEQSKNSRTEIPEKAIPETVIAEKIDSSPSTQPIENIDPPIEVIRYQNNSTIDQFENSNIRAVPASPPNNTVIERTIDRTDSRAESSVLQTSTVPSINQPGGQQDPDLKNETNRA